MSSVSRNPNATVMRDAIVIPIKDFDLAKERLRSGGVADVAQLAERLARRVIASARPRHIIVLSESDSVTTFANQLQAEVIVSNARSLNEAVQGAYEALGERFEQLLIVHGDLRTPQGIGEYQPGEGVTIVTDHHRRGTNVLCLPTRLNFQFAFGPDSLATHQREAARLKIECHVLFDSPWSYDVDEPSDLTAEGIHQLWTPDGI